MQSKVPVDRYPKYLWMGHEKENLQGVAAIHVDNIMFTGSNAFCEQLAFAEKLSKELTVSHKEIKRMSLCSNSWAA